MRTAALIFGILGGLCGVVGGLTAGGVIPLLASVLTWTFWFMLCGIFLLGSISFAVYGRGGE